MSETFGEPQPSGPRPEGGPAGELLYPALTRGFLTGSWLTVRTQILLGVVFVVAALPKIADPPSFAHMIHNYRLVPQALLPISAVVLPWFELLCGTALILGVFRRTAVTWIGVLLLVFIAAISVNLARGNAIDCGCFDVSAAGKTREERLADMRFVILRDLGMLVLVAQILVAGRREDRETT